MIRLITGISVLVLVSFSIVYAADYEITRITPIFDKATPGFGDFKIEVGIKNISEKASPIKVTCFYVGLTNPGVCVKNEPQIKKAYRVVTVKPRKEMVLVFDRGFVAYHPEVQGEIVVSIVGSGVVRSLPLRTAFHPNSKD